MAEMLQPNHYRAVPKSLPNGIDIILCGSQGWPHPHTGPLLARSEEALSSALKTAKPIVILSADV